MLVSPRGVLSTGKEPQAWTRVQKRRFPSPGAIIFGTDVKDKERGKHRIWEASVQRNCLVEKISPPVGEVLLEVLRRAVPEQDCFDADRKDEPRLFCRPCDVNFLGSNATRKAPFRTAGSCLAGSSRSRAVHAACAKFGGDC